MATEILRNGLRFYTDEAPDGFGWISKQEATRLLNRSEKTLEVWSKVPNHQHIRGYRTTSDNKVQYLVKLPMDTEAQPTLTEVPSEDITELIRQSTEALREEFLNRDQTKENLIAELKQKNFELNKTLEFSEKAFIEKEKSLKELLAEKEILIKELQDRVSQDKEHIQAEKQRADMASTQLMNANTALQKWREDNQEQKPETKGFKWPWTK